jgi:hypothetical protein
MPLLSMMDDPAPLHHAVATPGWHLLLCGPTDAWPREVSQLGHGYTDGLLAVHHLTAQNAPGALYDPDGTALHRLGLKPRDIALYLVRPDGHIGYRTGGPHRTGLASYLDRWLPRGRPRPDQAP